MVQYKNIDFEEKGDSKMNGKTIIMDAGALDIIETLNAAGFEEEHDFRLRVSPPENCERAIIL